MREHLEAKQILVVEDDEDIADLVAHQRGVGFRDVAQVLQPLLDIAHNMWWTWHPEAVELFKRVDHNLWERFHHNPVQMLGNCSQDTLEQIAFIVCISECDNLLFVGVDPIWNSTGQIILPSPLSSI